MIKPQGIPTVRNLNLYVQLKSTAVQLKRGGRGYQSGGGEFHERFQGLRPPVYEAPEGEDLRSSTRPVQQHSEDFGWRLQRVSETLWHFADSAWQRENELRLVQSEAVCFVNSIKQTGDEWKRSDELVARNNALVDRVENALAGRLADEVRAHNEIQGLIGGPILPPDGGQGGSSGKEPPWGTREKSPSILDRFIWDTSFGALPYFEVMPSNVRWLAEHYFRLGNPIRAAVGGLLIGGPNLIYHHVMNPTGQLQKDLEALNGIAQLVVGFAMNPTWPLSAVGWDGPALVKRHLLSYQRIPEGVRNWLTDADKAAASFVGFDKFGKGDYSGAAGTFIANVGSLLLTRKLPAGLGVGKFVEGLGQAGRFAKAASGMNLPPNFGKWVDNQMPRVGRGANAFIDGAPLRFIKEESRAITDAGIKAERVADDADLARIQYTEKEGLENAQAARNRQIEQNQQDLAATVARNHREADIVKAFQRQDFDNGLADQRRVADAERPPTPDEVRARRQADIEAAVKRDDDDNAVADRRVEVDEDIKRRQVEGATDRAIDQAVERARLGARQEVERTTIDVERRHEDDVRKAQRDDFDKGRGFDKDPKRFGVVAFRELRRFFGTSLGAVDSANAADPFTEGRPLDDAADRLQRDLGIDRTEAEALVEQFVRARRSGVTVADIDALERRINGDGLAGLRRELDRLERQPS